MKSQEDVVLSIHLNGRVLAAIGIAALLVVLLFSRSGAQAKPAPDVNTDFPESRANSVPAAPISFPEPPEGFVWTANSELIPIESLGKEPAASQAIADVLAAPGSRGEFYLTNTSYLSNQALTACGSGYHMASLWEIIDPTNLSYNFNHPAAYTKVDSGQGPPSGWYGRVRTGTDSSTSATAGIGNCSTWTSVAVSDYGVFARLSRSWEAPPAEIGGIWDITAFTCSVTGPVWCVRD